MIDICSSLCRRLGVCALAFLLLSFPVFAQIPAFPGAEGFGAYATGGRGGDVYTVVNLNSSGAGSLRYGVETAPAQGRTIVFAVSGYIPINNNSDTGNKTVRIVQNKVTIAGQTAPGDGIGLKDGRILMTGNNLVLRHLRIRHGKNGGAGDCINLESTADNSIIDHISLMFSTDENISFFNSTLDNFTMQYCTSSWGMERHNAGGLWDLQDGTCHHTLWAHHRTRNPKARPFNGVLEWINNVTYHWRVEGFIMGDSQTPANWSANVRGCYYLSIPDYGVGVDNTPFSKARIASDGLPNFHLYLDNCLHDANNDGLLNGTDKGYGIVSGQPYNPAEGAAPGTERYDKSLTPFTGATGLATVNIDPPLTAYKKVLSSSGALRLDATYAGPLRDELDSLLITSVENQESILVAKDTPVTTDPEEPPSNGEAHLASPPYNISNNGFGTLNTAPAPLDTDLDGMPDFWENTLGWNAASQDHNTVLATNGGYITGLTFFPSNTVAGYTRLEEYLHFMAIPHATIPANLPGGPSSLSVDLRRYTSGFNKAPVTFACTNIINGTVTLQPDGYTAVFTPTLNFSGRARFDFKVTDGDGSTWTQTAAVLVSGTLVPPLAPTNLTATAISSSKIVLGWTDASANETGFKIERSTDGTSFGEIDSVNTDVTTYTNVVASATAYHYRIRSYNPVGNSAYSNTNNATTPAGPPGAPPSITAAGANSRVDVSWGTSPGATSYRLQRSTTSGSGYATIANTANSSFTDLYAFNGATYYYVISAINAYGESANSAPASATPSDSIVYPAEYAAFGNGAIFEASNAGYHDTGYVNAAVTNGSYIQFDDVDAGGGGTCTLRFRTALGGSNTNRLGRLIINGVTNSLLFTSTGAFTTWVDRSFVTPLNPGDANSVRLESTGNDLANIDEMTVVGTPVPPPTATPSFGSISVTASNLIMTGSGGTPGGNYYVLTAANAALPSGSWTRLVTNQFDGAGGFVFTNPIAPGAAQSYFRLQLP